MTDDFARRGLDTIRREWGMEEDTSDEEATAWLEDAIYEFNPDKSVRLSSSDGAFHLTTPITKESHPATYSFILGVVQRRHAK